MWLKLLGKQQKKMYLCKQDILNILNKPDGLFIRPLLNLNQISELTIDFRLGFDFLVSIQGREPFINASKNEDNVGQVSSFFQETRRKLGETFLLHPNQTVLTSSLEYIKLPSDIFAILTMRSSYSRLGLNISSIIQPGYSGCISLELTNNNNNPINLTIGACIFQVRLYRLNDKVNYFAKRRKYICQVRPFVPTMDHDEDLERLNILWKKENNVASLPTII